MARATSISRQVSTHAVMSTILHKGPISRAGISRETGLSKQTSSEIVRLLELEGWIEETGLAKGKTGRSAVLYQVVAEAAYIVGVDLGGTKVTAAIADMTGGLVAEATQPTHPEGGQRVVDQIVDLCKQLAQGAGVERNKIKLGVIGVPGVVNPPTGFVEFAPNLPGFDKLAVQEALTTGLGFDVVLENDVNLAVLGERWQGAGQGCDNLAFIALGTGIGQGLLIGGNLVRGAHGGAGEIGYLPVGTDPFTETARTVGAFEAAVAAQAILRSYKAKNGAGETVREVFDLAGAGEPTALAVLDEIARVLALGIAATAALFDPEKVILGGGIGGRPEIVARIRHILPECMRYPVPIEASALGGRASVLGALAVGLTKLHGMLYGTQVLDQAITVPPADELLVHEVGT